MAGTPADAALSIAEATAGDQDGPLVVDGFIVAEVGTVRLCELLLESFPPQYGGNALRVDGLDLDAYDTQDASGVRWTDAQVPVRGEIDGETLRAGGTHR